MGESIETPYILLVDDDAELCDLVSQYLRGRGFRVESEGDGEKGLERAQSGQYDLLVLDVMLPGINGFEILRRLRATPETSLPVVMLTAHGDEIDRIVGLELGADDYLPKPFNPRELLARMRAVLRRGSEKAALPTSENGKNTDLQAPITGPSAAARRDPNHWLDAGELTMDVGARAVRQADESVELTATEFDLLHVLMQHTGRVVTRDDLSQKALGRRLLPFDRSLDLHMSKLRRKLGPKSNGAERIRTLRGVGFLLERDEVSQSESNHVTAKS
jgi:DNA-binding response OmpR family regulator